ncbi:MAG: nicotinate (nicotinamide) nucleotide adenylyltransferase [Clostridiales Family XIII bacterium]|jgi:nicotinate-nucleotide adenylyltransferase|nr:nicotinate (nicotinamide) nucleotide adenylyltransferase [Clostridiales Family XIII bacterium]
MRIGVFGGSFDPVHSGHLLVAEEARVGVGLSEVVFVPTFIQPFKQDMVVSPSDDRVRMLRLAIEGNPYFRVSTFEVDRAEVSYTINTLRGLRAEYEGGGLPRFARNDGDGGLRVGARNDSEAVDIAFIVGTDMFLMLEKWYLADELLREFSIILCTRPGYKEIDAAETAAMIRRKYGTNIDIIENTTFDVSSTQIRDRVAIGESIRYLVPESVRQYLLVMAKEDEARFAHTKRVIDMAASMAQRFGVEPEKARLAALLHDYCKENDGGVENNLMHGRQAADFAIRELGITDEDVINAIAYHTTGRAGMTDLEQIIFLADTVEPGRTYKDIAELRRTSLENLTEGTLTVLESLAEYLVGAKFEVTEDTRDAIVDLRRRLGE